MDATTTPFRLLLTTKFVCAFCSFVTLATANNNDDAVWGRVRPDLFHVFHYN